MSVGDCFSLCRFVSLCVCLCVCLSASVSLCSWLLPVRLACLFHDDECFCSLRIFIIKKICQPSSPQNAHSHLCFCTFVSLRERKENQDKAPQPQQRATQRAVKWAQATSHQEQKRKRKSKQLQTKAPHAIRQGQQHTRVIACLHRWCVHGLRSFTRSSNVLRQRARASLHRGAAGPAPRLGSPRTGGAAACGR